MKILNLVQGSDEWLAARAKYHTASEAPSMMGCGRAKRSELLRMKATGDVEEFSSWVEEVLFPQGHETEALARPVVEGIIGDELFPVTAVDDDGFLLASFDGLTMCETIVWESKMWNADKAADVGHGKIPDVDYWQVVQQLHVSQADRCIYTVTDGTPEKTLFVWVTRESIKDDIDKLLAHWRQFSADLEGYEHQETVVEAVGRAPDALPSLLVEVTGLVKSSNLEAFRDHALEVFAGISTELSTDGDFADADKTVKWCKSVEEKLDAAKDQALSQTATIDELFRAIDAIKAESRAKRLELEKLVKARKAEIRGEIITAGKGSLDSFVALVNSQVPGRLVVPTFPVDFAAVMKNKRTVASLKDAVETELARVKIEINQVAERIRSNATVFDAAAEGYESLFSDLQSLVLKDSDDFLATVRLRISDHKAELVRRGKEKAESEAKAVEDAVTAATIAPVEKTSPVAAPAAKAKGEPVAPTYAEIVGVVANHYRVDPKIAADWINTIVRSAA